MLEDIVDDRATTSDFATVVAQIVPVLMLAAVVTPLRIKTKAADRHLAFWELILTGLVIAASLVSEVVALFGVLQGGLTKHDTIALTWLVLITAALAALRMLAPLASPYSGMAGVPESRVLGILGVVIVVAFVGVFVGVNYAVG